MPTGKEFSVAEKKLIFRVIDFCESERNGLKIPLTNTSARIMALLGISYSSVNRLKKELNELRDEATMKDTSEDEDIALDVNGIRTRSQSATIHSRNRHRKTKKIQLQKTIAISASSSIIPDPRSPRKAGNVGRPRVVLNEAGEDEIRYHFHLILVRVKIRTPSNLK